MFKNDGKAPADGEAFVKPFDPKVNKQVENAVKLDSMEQSLKLVHNFDFPSQKDTAW